MLTILLDEVENSKSRAPATGISAVQKLEARRLQTLTRQREKLEAEVRALEEEILKFVSSRMFSYLKRCLIKYVGNDGQFIMRYSRPTTHHISGQRYNSTYNQPFMLQVRPPT
jgi:hypothetical protein